MIYIILIILGFFGFSALIREKFALDIYFIPFAYFSVISSLIYISALLGFMKIGSYFFHFVFAVICLYYGFTKIVVFRDFINYWILVLIGIFIILYLKNEQFLHYDDFSHWGLISRFLISHDRLNFGSDKLITFTSYPQASAYFIYGLTRPLGFSEPFCFMANAFAVLAGYFPIFKKSKDNRYMTPVFIIFSIYILMDNVQINSLLVDSLLATSGFSLLAFISEYDFIENKNLLIILLPMIISVSLIKNSALFFVVVAALYMLKKYWRADKFVAGFPLLIMFLANKSWSIHVKKNFNDLGKHSMSFSSYKKGLLDKNMSTIFKISSNFIKAIFEERILLILFIFLVVTYFIYNKDKVYKNLLIFVVCVYFTYQLGNYLMYIFSMPSGEAVKLAGYGRYVKTIRSYLLLMSVYWMPFDKNKIITVIMAVFMASLSFTTIKKLNYKDENRKIYASNKEKLSEAKITGENKRILVKMNEQDKSSYYYFMARYLYDTNDVRITYPEDDNNYNISDFDYYIDITSK
ncbi:hypothetical protein [Anaerococcus sp. AGMB09787]|uniref:hypothetical protein n=1 Tax=Anaerococcus sp. AGMB09787 TaxID=2922869 RepID=UPI001FAF593D|nr:hypothetical protein [Anaerococcus sp. AGMB09787]